MYGRSARSLQRRAATASSLVRGSLFKGRVLNPIHLNQVKEDRKCGNVEEKKKREKDVDVTLMKKQNDEKCRVRTHYPASFTPTVPSRQYIISTYINNYSHECTSFYVLPKI
jgi:hypothetical protein